MSDRSPTETLTQRFGDSAGSMQAPAELSRHLARGSCRVFTSEQPSLPLVDLLCAAALAAPSKSDLQQRDILVVDDPAKTETLKALLGAQEWIAGAPRLLLFLANNRRQRQVQAMHDQPFPNDHLDAFFNASLDAGIALAFFMSAAEAMGLGCCPVSTVRNHLKEIAALFELPDHVFPVAGLALGYPAADAPRISPRLGLAATVHKDRFRDTTRADISRYDARRQAIDGKDEWSEAKARMYASPQRTDFAGFIRSIGFRLD